MHDEHDLRQVPPDARDDAAVRHRRPPHRHRRAAQDLRGPAARREPRLRRPRHAHRGLLDVLHDRGADRAADDRGAVHRRPRPRAADQGRAADERAERHVPGQDRPDPAARRALLPRAARRRPSRLVELVNEATAAMAGGR